MSPIDYTYCTKGVSTIYPVQPLDTTTVVVDNNTKWGRDMPSKKLIIVFGIILLALAAGAFFAVGPQQSKPAIKLNKGPTVSPKELLDWRTYIDSAYGYSIMYPSDWYLKPSEGIGGTTTISNYDIDRVPLEELVKPLGPNRIKVEISISLKDKPLDLSLEEWLVKQEIVPEATKPTKDIIVDGVSGLDYQPQELDGMRYIIVAKENKVYYLALWPANSNYKETFEKMVTTFQFAKE
jgi:hypothetical protein